MQNCKKNKPILRISRRIGRRRSQPRRQTMENKYSLTNVSKKWRQDILAKRANDGEQVLADECLDELAPGDANQEDKQWIISVHRRMFRRIGPKRPKPRSQTMDNKYSQANVEKKRILNIHFVIFFEKKRILNNNFVVFFTRKLFINIHFVCFLKKGAIFQKRAN